MIAAMSETGLTNGEPSETVLTNIRREARVRAGTTSPTRLWMHALLRPGYGLATVAALCLAVLSGWWLLPNANSLTGEAELKTILLMLSESTESAYSNADTASVNGETPSLDTLASALLSLQGLDAGYTDSELSSATQDETLPATTPLTRNTAARHAERYG